MINEPAKEFDALSQLRFGSNQHRYVDVMLNVPLTTTTAMRFSAVRDKSNGFVRNATNGERVGDSHSWGARLAFKWMPDAATKAILTWEHQGMNQGARPAFGVSPKVASGNLPPFSRDPEVLRKSFIDPLNSPLQNDAPSRETLQLDAMTLRWEVPLYGMSLSSITSWRQFDTFNRQDNDGTSNIATYLDTANSENNANWQQTFQLNAKNDRFDWVTGVGFFRAKVTQNSDVNTNTDSLDTVNLNTAPFASGGIPSGIPLFPVLYGFALGNGSIGSGGAPLSGTRWSERMMNNMTSESSSIYSDVIFHITPATNATVGIRYTHDTKQMNWYVPAATSSDPNTTAISNAVLGLNNIIFANASLLASSPVSDLKSWNDLSPRLVLDHRLDNNTMLFTSLSRGYQSGGFNVFVPGGSFAPEIMTNLEAGLKSYFPKWKLNLNASLFSYRFKNLQNIDLISGVPLPTYVVTNSDQKATGFDIDGNIKLSNNVRLFGAFEYIDQVYINKVFKDGLGVERNLSGQVTGHPSLHFTGGVSLSWQVFDGWAELSLQANHISKTRCNIEVEAKWGCLKNGVFKTGEPKNRADLNLTWRNSTRRFNIGLIVNNLFNKRYLGAPGGQSVTVFGTPYASISSPRYVGIQLGYGM